MPSELLPISSDEKKWVNQLTTNRGWIYHFSRGCVRNVMSEISGLDPLEIPLKADPGKPPLLAEGWGHISISHCSDALLIGWSAGKIGVDLERRDRKIKAQKLSRRFFTKSENYELENLNPSETNEQVLRRWVVKEAAIKWQSAKISTNISQWIWTNNSSFVSHKKLGHHLKVYNQSYKKWIFTIALNTDLKINNPILCIH
ncbi:4-phosphopantetheinyl transferase [Prochlorococcus marinus XMU1408]|uniref:4-phosphopantetheinyl transferase n=2 Tax=Prochlorococcus marinus TaxID=1219 RepID=A0A318R6J7_PROMR|nr:4'-phosphopantetheinyl transferase superfamily protein [Prochlorococcus marinus]MBW3041137.1 4-phosphopantetheinyl transferase [Prochlorococcus marinus str. XMU1408]PYE03883.1 4-phosphopantetheinyl transferase [Prochlorococcus marinus XMU1408]